MIRVMRLKTRLRLALALVGLTVGGALHAQEAPVAGPWAASFAAFDAADQARPPPAGGVVFVGSSSIRLWEGLEESFQGPPVVLRRGFGGSTLADCVAHLKRLVIAYRPRQVVVYAGENDLAQGRRPEEVAERFRALVEGLRADLPEVRIAYISIKPSPARVHLLPEVKEANRQLKALAASYRDVEFIDVFHDMLDEQGLPRATLFAGDALHLNASGYALWRQRLADYVR